MEGVFLNTMINYSVSLRKNPMNRDAAAKAYGTAQVTDSLSLSQFAAHISEHHSKYGKGDIYAVLIEMVSCMREQLLLGNSISLGDMGTFRVTLGCKGADTIADFSESNIKKINVVWSKGDSFQDLRKDATFHQVLTRKENAEAIAEK